MATAKHMNPVAASTMNQSSTGLHQSLKLTTIDIIGGIYCHICHITFGDKKNFDTHYVKHNTGSNEVIYTCVKCHKEISGYPSFRGHCYTSHVIKNRYKCNVCFKLFSKLQSLEDHVDSLHKFKCLSCKKEFASKKELQVHQIMHKEDIKPLKCLTCMEGIDSAAVCENHIEKHSVFTYSCPICNESITKETANEHLRIHFGNVLKADPEDFEFDEEMHEESSIDLLGGITCCYCGIIGKNRMEMDLHFSVEHEDKVVIYSCNICGKQFEKYTNFGDHCYNHLAKDRFVCDKCFKTFPRLSLLVVHTEACQTATKDIDRPFKCLRCQHKFADEKRLRGHLRDVHGVHCIKCPEDGCEEIFSTPKDLILHQRNHKNNDNRCRQCGLHFASLSACERHLNLHKKKLYSCPICNKTYGEKYLVLKHVPQHFEAVLHICKVCGKMYNAKNRLMEHTKTHSNAKNYCRFCGKGFTYIYKLKQHLNIHTGLRPYKCVVCTKSFTNHPNWFKHLQRMHNIDPKTLKKPVVEYSEDVINMLDDPEDRTTNENSKDSRNAENNDNSIDYCNEFDTVTDTSDSQLSNIDAEKQHAVDDNIDMLEDYDESEVITDTIHVKDPQELEKDAHNVDNSTNNVIENYGEYEMIADSELVQPSSSKMKNKLSTQDIDVCTMTKENYNIFTESIPNEGPVALESIEPSIVGEKHIFEGNVVELTNVLPTANSSFIHEPSEAMAGEARTMGFPPEYGPEFLNVGGLAGPAGQVIDLDDHIMPHIDPLLTLKAPPEPGAAPAPGAPPAAALRDPLHIDHALPPDFEPILSKLYTNYTYGYEYTDIDLPNKLSVINTDIYI